MKKVRIPRKAKKKMINELSREYYQINLNTLRFKNRQNITLSNMIYQQDQIKKMAVASSVNISKCIEAIKQLSNQAKEGLKHTTNTIDCVNRLHNLNKKAILNS